MEQAGNRGASPPPYEPKDWLLRGAEKIDAALSRPAWRAVLGAAVIALCALYWLAPVALLASWLR
ncbi:hypothetical protein [Chenggangzhangella methanolivorans]|uniref:Uncharacterized protein n=1 Tax=Chenggangzhangella methanolivorans TaxID=1437009 RepID=A0A9E6UPB7_9HYPH|nr:hypothetical protein [Chenggangzhangella methanolivorans]QZN99569.1 hypothetical protein K6K41_23135 [Chenggangzhangella methanolivorans]